jgi:hypothetical protein
MVISLDVLVAAMKPIAYKNGKPVIENGYYVSKTWGSVLTIDTLHESC